MKTKPLVILSSARKDGHTRALVQKLFAGLEIETLDLLDFNISHYNYQNNYPDQDQFLQVMKKLLLCDNLILATPVYWYSMSGHLKVFLDRLTDVVTVQKELGRGLKSKKVFLVSAGTDEHLPEGFEVPFRLTARYLGMHFIDTYYSAAKNLSDELPGQVEFISKVRSS